MKKIWLAIVAIILIAIVSSYVFIPSNIIVRTIVYTNVNSTSVLRCLHDDIKWQQWFPGKISNSNFYFNNQHYQLKEDEYTSKKVLITNNNINYTTAINVLPLNIDSSALEWRLEFKTSNNPFKRIKQYEIAKNIKNNMTVLLDRFKIFIGHTKNIYGFDIQHSTLTDTALVSIKTVTKQYPSTQLIYSIIDTLKEYIKQQHATVHNYPMLNIIQKEDSYEVRVAVPENIPLPGNNIIEPRKMVMLKNKTLVTEVIGDNNTIQKAFDATNNYMDDYRLSPPVIPFQQLVTNRNKEKDSTKWITKIFTPII